MTIAGFDASHYQRITSWSSLKRGAQFGIFKATEGTSFHDPSYAGNRLNARRSGLPLGAYHFASGSASPNAEADWFLHNAGLQLGELAGLDIEAGILKLHRGAALVNWCSAWLGRVAQATGRTPCIYLNMSTINANNWSALSKLYPLWLAWPGASAPSVRYWGHPMIWQHNWQGRLAGIAGNVDLNIWTGTTAQYNQAFGIAQPKPAPPKPTPIQEDDMPTAAEVAQALMEYKIPVRNALHPEHPDQVVSFKGWLEQVFNDQTAATRDLLAIAKDLRDRQDAANKA